MCSCKKKKVEQNQQSCNQSIEPINQSIDLVSQSINQSINQAVMYLKDASQYLLSRQACICIGIVAAGQDSIQRQTQHIR